jgi:hypothetical protein
LYEIPIGIGIWSPIIAFKHLLSYEKTKVYGDDKPFFFSYIKHGKQELVVYHEEVQMSFSCPFNFENYPFDSNECTLEFGSKIFPTKRLKLKPSKIIYEDVSPPTQHKLSEDPMILNDLPHPFNFKFNLKPAFEKTSAYNYSFSYAGVEIKMKRKMPSELLSGYYYPMAAFALLSMISFLIKADVVSKSFYGTSVLKLCTFEFVVIHEI